MYARGGIDPYGCVILVDPPLLDNAAIAVVAGNKLVTFAIVNKYMWFQILQDSTTASVDQIGDKKCAMFTTRLYTFPALAKLFRSVMWG